MNLWEYSWIDDETYARLEELQGKSVAFGKFKQTSRYYKILHDTLYPDIGWSTMNNVVYSNQTLCLRHFPSRKKVDAKRPVLVLPPQAGHHSNLSDYSTAQSLVRVFQRYGYEVYVCHWMSATPEFKDLGLADYI
ncbi:MAG: hypothetical protein PHD40_06680, partial [Syntrophomonadaceae bacterium]|nr:hypothetical protein [Syntrophomonadaceae bacterium]